MALGSFNALFYLFFFGICSTSTNCDDLSMLTLLQSASSKNKLFLRRPNSSSVDGDSQCKHVKEAFEGNKHVKAWELSCVKRESRCSCIWWTLLHITYCSGSPPLVPVISVLLWPPHERLCVIVSLGYFLEAWVYETGISQGKKDERKVRSTYVWQKFVLNDFYIQQIVF